ncbi:hypothetical protein [Egicoccus sp. AB-alg2]|uniref:hypothetical protein n=1 Tax=Egicoccus sp. AB-alg2 TaxID=3242693 RepID=UPI00359F0B14
MRAPQLSVAVLLTAGLLGCAEPQLPDQPSAEGAEAPAEQATPQPERDALLAATNELTAAVEQARDLLTEAGQAPEPAAARQAAQQALAVLVDGAGSGTPPGRPIFPGTTVEERGGAGEADDALTLALTAANDAGGSLGRGVADALRDPLAGDLGAWQRDPAGMVALVEEQMDGVGDLESAEQLVRELPGDGTRALAWAYLTAGATTMDDAARYAERGAAHLEIVLVAVDAALDGAGPSA